MAKKEKVSAAVQIHGESGSDSHRASRESGNRAAGVATRESILQAARQRFLHYGFKKTTIDEIAGDAGVGKGTVYLYFEGKDEIMLTLVLDVKNSITRQMQQIAAGDEPADTKLERMILALILTSYDACTTSAHGNELVEDFRCQLEHCPRFSEAFIAEHSTQLEAMEAVIAQGASCGLLRKDVKPNASRLLIAAFREFYPPFKSPIMPLWRSREELEASARELFAFIMDGLRRSPAALPSEKG